MLKSTKELEKSDESVADFYIEKTVFITGCTGFIGKVLIAKLLHSCPKIQMIYVLIRPKRAQNTHERLQELLCSPAFDEVRRVRPLDLQKIHAICGDIGKPLLGINTGNYKMLLESVDVVFHTAATVKFNEALKSAVTINLFGTQRLVEMCKKMTHLSALIHVSTVYANCDRETIEEVIYPPRIDPEIISRAAQEWDDGFIELMTPRLLAKHPNTYTFTKSLTEKWLSDNYGNLPLVIVRPSIVIASITEPTRGWLDTWNGPTAYVGAIGKGIVRSIYVESVKLADLIPVDMVVNLILVTAWRIGTKPSKEIVIYNCVSGLKRSVTWKYFFDTCLESIRHYPFKETIWYPNCPITTSRFEHCIKYYFLQYPLAYILDEVRWLVGNKRIMVNVLSKLDVAAHAYFYFINNQWNFDDTNVRMLISSLSKYDRQNFCFDASTIKWDCYIKDYVQGIRRFLMKDDLTTIDNARKTLRILFWGNWSIQMFALMALMWSVSLIT